MENEMIFSSGADMIYLAACAIHGKVPDPNIVAQMDLAAVYDQAARHYMQAVTYQAIDSYINAYGNKNISVFEDKLKIWKNDRIRAIKHTVSFEMERERILDFFEKNNIWYLPLKGIVVQEYYPAIGMRQMSDNDILYNSEYRLKLREYMFELGYDGKVLDLAWPDTYVKNMFAFEMHHSLFTTHRDEQRFNDYYKNIESKFIREEDSCKCCLGPEDFYIYLSAHAYKHFSTCGTGVRSLMDVYIYLENVGVKLDFEYINSELKKLGILRFEEAQKNLAYALFSKDCVNLNVSTEILDNNANDLLKYYIDCGVYGNLKNLVVNRLKPKMTDRGGERAKKISYLCRRIFPEVESYRRTYPFAYKHRIFMPVAWFLRLVKGVFLKFAVILRELKLIAKTK